MRFRGGKWNFFVTLSLRFLIGLFSGARTYNFGKIFICMYKLAAIFFFVFVMAGASRLQAQQTLKGTAWKFYVDALHDTLTMHIGLADTSYTTTSVGDVVVRSVSRLQNDTLRMRDFAGEYYCPDGEGVYRISVEGDYMTFFMISDPCTNRSDAINGVKFRKATVSK
jgi:hypothetical protein